MKKKIAVDLDGTLAYYDHFRGLDHIGDPIPITLQRVKRALAEGHEVWIFTARACANQTARDTEVAIGAIRFWCRTHLGQYLPITADKDFTFSEFWDDRAVQFRPNTGITVEVELAVAQGALDQSERLRVEALELARLVGEERDRFAEQLAQLQTAHARLQTSFEALQQSADATRQELEAHASGQEALLEPEDPSEPESLPCPIEGSACMLVECADALNPARSVGGPLCAEAARCHQVLEEKAPGLVRLHKEVSRLASVG